MTPGCVRSYTQRHTVGCVKELPVATNLDLNDQLINEARKLGKHRTKKDAVTAALEEYVQRKKQLKVLDLFGKIHFAPEYDHKAARRAR